MKISFSPPCVGFRNDCRNVLFTLLAFFHLSLCSASAALTQPPSWPGNWTTVDRAQIQTNDQSLTISSGYVVNNKTWDDAQITFSARAPLNADQVQIWAGFRYRDRDSRYVFALRGGNDNDIYLARYAPNGGAEFLGFAPLDFKPRPGAWYRLRVVVLGNRFQIFLNDEQLPRLNVTDNHPLWSKGNVLLGGGWLPVEFSDFQIKPLSHKDKAVFQAIGNKCWTTPPVDKVALRKKERSEYSSAKVTSLGPLRTTVPLNGNWLFMPDYELPAADQTPVQANCDDQDWNVMQVPSFWTPALSWLHGEAGFTNLDEFSRTKGVAESLYVQRLKQCDSYTFDWRKTRAAWYRHYVDLPSQLDHRHFELTFDAIAKVSDVWVNGIEVGKHTGMFGQVKYDVTRAIKPGRNVIAVHVIGQPVSSKNNGNKVEDVAETVEVTSDMLNSLPHGMFQENVGGIWQPVTLTATAPTFVNDCFIQTGLHDADINLEITNSASHAEQLGVTYKITSARDGTLLYSNEEPASLSLPAGSIGHLKLTTPPLEPKLWSPQEPNLYKLDVALEGQGRTIDNYTIQFGFRTFSFDGNRFLLNGHPFWLRGANPFPNTMCPNDAVLAHRFMQIAHEGNVRVTRSHIVPYTSTWLDAADEEGIAVSFEGTWPWLMLRGDPDDELIKDWKDEYISLIKEYRNHPSIILWTVNNEMKFETSDPKTIQKKWTILSDTIKAMREADPTRPIVADSSYVRKKALQGYQTLVKPEGLDDGDVDDVHHYYGWYYSSFFHLYDGEFNELSTPGRPLISQEMSTGYPNNDDGHPVRFYLFKHYVPQALVGDDAYENADPAIFLRRQAFMTKELAETLRRTTRGSAAGLLLFSYFTWFQTPWLVDGIKPWPAYDALKTALQPVLVSAELYGRHMYSGSTFEDRVCVVNDSEDYQAIPKSRLVWEFRDGDRILSQGQIAVPSIGYYENHWLDVKFNTPESLPTPRTDAQLVLRLESEDGRMLSTDNYDVVLATPEWAKNDSSNSTNIVLWNPDNKPTDCLSDLPITRVDSIESLKQTDFLVIAPLDDTALTPSETSQLKSFVSGGGRVLMLHPKKSLASLFPDQVKSYKAKNGEIVSMHIPESPVFSGIEPLDIAWFGRGQRQLPIACTGVYQIAEGRKDISALADQCDLHGYLNSPSLVQKYGGTPLVEIRIGKGCLLASELNFESAANDPIAKRLLSNIINYPAPKGF